MQLAVSTIARVAAVALLAMGGCCEKPGEPSAIATEFRPDPNLIAERIPGGPSVLMIPQRSVPMFASTVLIPAGAALETAETNGAAHYLEHLLFNGTTSRTREEIYAETDRLGAYNNASTQRERTIFQLLLPSENWRDGMELQADMLLHSTLPPDKFEKEKGIILEELAKDRSDVGWEVDRFISGLLWNDDARALAVLGTEESIADMDRDALVAFYHERYRPESMVIVLMGDFDPEEARQRITSLYGTTMDAEPATAGPRDASRRGLAGAGLAAPPLPPRPDFPSGRTMHARGFPGLEKTQVRLLLPAPAFSAPDFAAALLLADVLGSGEQSAASRVVPDVMSSSGSLDGGEPWSVLSIHVDLPNDANGETAALMLTDHLVACVENGFGPDEVAAARRKFLVEQTFLREKMHYFGLMNSDLLGGGGPLGPERLLHEVEHVTPFQLGAVLARALEDGRMLAVVAGPEVEDGTSTLPAVDVGCMGRRKDRSQRDETPLAQALFPAEATEVTHASLDDGTDFVCHTSPEGRTFALHLLFRDRAAWEQRLDVPPGTADVLHRMLELGTTELSRDELRGLLAHTGVTLKVTDSDWIPYDDYYHSPEFSYVRVEAVDNHAPDAVSIVRDVLRHPRFDEETLATAVDAAAARAERDESSARTIAFLSYYRALGTNHPRRRGPVGTPDEIRGIGLADVQRLHSRYFQPENTILVVSANVDPERIRGELAKGLTPPPTGASEETPERTGAGYEPRKIHGREEILVEVGREQSYLVVGSPCAIPPADAAAFRVAVAILSERLAERLREEEGLAYTIGASARLAGPGAEVHMAAGTRPENLERLERGMREVATALARTPPTMDEITGARNRGEGRQRMRRLTRIGHTYAMAMATFRDDDPTALDADRGELAAVTPADVMRVARAHLRFRDSIVAIAR